MARCPPIPSRWLEVVPEKINPGKPVVCPEGYGQPRFVAGLTLNSAGGQVLQQN